MSWINNTTQPAETNWWQSNDLASPEPYGARNDDGWNGAIAPSDGYRPTWWGGGSQTPGAYSSAANGPTGASSGILGQILGLLQQLVAGLGLGNASNAGANGPSQFIPFSSNGSPGTTFQNATLSSTGDPHLALDGTETNADGSTTAMNDHFDDMHAHRDLFSTNDFGDRFRVSTTVTQPNANGVTLNATATAHMNGGRDSVTMGPGGALTVIDDGRSVALGAGQTIALSGGETVSEASNGSVSIAERNANGESLTTTFSNNGSGVDVNATASGGVTLAGDLVRHAMSAAYPSE